MKTDIKPWRPLPTSKAGSGFFVTEKFVGTLYADDGTILGQTGKCVSKRGCRMALHRLMQRIGL